MTILEEAIQLTSRDRNDQYGDSSVEFLKVVSILKTLGKETIDCPENAAWFFIVNKLVREAYKPKRDNRVDACGYLHLLDKLYK